MSKTILDTLRDGAANYYQETLYSQRRVREIEEEKLVSFLKKQEKERRQKIEEFKKIFENGFNKGFDEGFNIAFNKGYDKGYDRGYYKGYDRGYEEAMKKFVCEECCEECKIDKDNKDAEANKDKVNDEKTTD